LLSDMDTVIIKNVCKLPIYSYPFIRSSIESNPTHTEAEHPFWSYYGSMSVVERIFIFIFSGIVSTSSSLTRHH
jgi:hypothetical protein